LQVRQRLEAGGLGSLLVTSALDGEGKTFTACNLALALASMAGEQRVALVDLDLRDPSVHIAMGVEVSVGLEGVLAREIPLDAACVRTDLPALDLFLLPRPVPRAHEVLASSAFPDILRQLASEYATIVCDTPPTILVPDVALIAAHVGACVVVARAGTTRLAAFREMVGLLPPDKVIGSFLNDAHVPRHRYNYVRYDLDEESGQAG
jgi:Mrp family chromosome partitioning ATPase